MPGKSKCSRRKRQNGDSPLSHSASCNGQAKDEKQILQSAKDHDKDEIFKLRVLNQRLIQVIDNLRQESEASLLQEAEMESQLHILQAALTNFESSMDKQLMQGVEFGEELSKRLMDVDREFRQQVAKRDQEYEAEICKAWQQLQEAEERYKREISEKEEDCREAISDKQTLEASVLLLTDKIRVMSGELEEVRKAWELEKNGLFSQIVAAQKQIAEIAKCNLTAEQAWNAEKENLLSSLIRKYEKKIEDICTEKQRVLFEKIEWESQVNDSRASTRELLENIVENGHLWEAEKEDLQRNVAELQTKIDSMASERVLLCQKNRELSTEAESFKTQLNEYKTKLSQMENDKVQNERVLQQCRTEKIDLQAALNDSKERTQDLLRKNEESMHLWYVEKSNMEATVAEMKENRYLEAELDRKTLVSEEEKVRFEHRVMELLTTFNSLNEEIESSRAIAEEKERQLIALQIRHSDIVEAKKTLEKKNDYLLAKFNRCRMVSEENVRLQNRVNQLERTHDSLSRYIDCKNIRLRQFKSERQPLQTKRPVNVNGNLKPKPIGGLHENAKLDGLLVKLNGLLEKQKQE